MIDRAGTVRVAAALLMITTGAVPGWAAPDPAAAAPSIWAGAYTEAQARTGKDVFERACISCHSDTVGVAAAHGAAPAVVGEDFEFRWLDMSLADLFDTLRQTMPEAAPNSLSAEEYAALTAYLLALNGYPAGSEALDPNDRQRLLDVYIEARRQN